MCSGVSAGRAVLSASPADLQVVMTGYCQLSQAYEGCGLDAAIALNGVIRDACEPNPKCTYVESLDACGGGNSTWSEAATHVDAIHVGPAGYCRVFGREAAQTAFRCPASPIARCA